MNSVCIVAILKDEEPYPDEWIIYHKMLGIDHFFLYDDDLCCTLQDFMKPYNEYVTVINWRKLDVYVVKLKFTRAKLRF